MGADLDSARRDWGEGYRALLSAADGSEGDRLHRQVDAITDELRKRVGATFTLAELADVYAASEHWVREAVAARSGSPGWARTVATAGDAAFHLYARLAQDYTP